MSQEFEVVVNIFQEDERFYWSLVQNFGNEDDTPEPLAYGYADTFEQAARCAGDEIKSMWG